MISSRENCAVLLATFNGAKWIAEQLDSIANQQDVQVCVIASDDQSTDETGNIIRLYNKVPIQFLLNKPQRFGRANTNFLRLIAEADVKDASYVALADQDDIWHHDKLVRAIQQIEQNNAVAYSANVEAFWSDGTSKMLVKAYPQKNWDFLFGSPGPGCTFVLKREVFDKLRTWVIGHEELIKQAWVHDWWIYAYVRNLGYKWLIDDHIKMRYRQHFSNEIGANRGFSAIKKRYEIIKKGRYLSEVLLIAELVECNPPWLKRLKRFEFIDRLYLMCNSYAFRRSPYDVLALLLIFTIAPKPKFEGIK